MFKKNFSLIAIICTILLPTMANAEDQVVNNLTKNDFAISITESRICSTRFMQAFTARQKTNISPRLICGIFNNQCRQYLYDSAKCQSAPVAEVMVSQENGIFVVQNFSNKYDFNSHSLYLEINDIKQGKKAN